MDNLILQIQQDNEHAFKRLYQAYYIRVVRGFGTRCVCQFMD